MDEEIKENGEMATIEDEEEITIEEDYTALEAETIIIDDDSNIQTDVEYEQAVGQKELADEAREALSAVLLSVLEKGEINDDDIAEIAAQQEIYTENVTALKILGLMAEDEKSTGGKSTTNVITSNIDYNELIKVLSEKADWLYTDEDGQIMLNGEVVPKIKVMELEAEKIKADVGEFKDLTTENFTAVNAKIDNLEVGDLTAVNAEIENLKANKADIETLNANVATINTALIGKANVSDLNATNANIANLQAGKADITDLNAANGNITNLQSVVAQIQTLIGGNLTMDNIQSLILTSDKVTIADALIKNAMIDSVSANKINTGIINTNNVSIQSEDGSMLINGTTQQFKDENGKVRIQIGKDATGNFTFALFSQDGVGVLIDESGIKSGAVPDGLIVNDMVSDGANISGSKLDINSVISSINDGTTTIKGTRIQLDEQGQSLEVAFNQLKTKVETIENVTIDGDLSSVIEQVTSNTTNINIMQGQISSLISNTTITKENGEVVQLKDEYNSTKDTVNSHSTKIGSLETNLASANNNISSVSSKQTALEQNLNGFKQTVSDTYATKTDLNTVDDKFANYSTTSAINSAINQKANEITSTVSQTYATKTDLKATDDKFANYSTTSQMNSTINQKTDGILSTVSNNYTTKGEFNNLTISTRNLLLNTANSITVVGNGVENQLVTAYRISVPSLLAGKTATLSFKYTVSNWNGQGGIKPQTGNNTWDAFSQVWFSANGTFEYESTITFGSSNADTELQIRADWLGGTVTILPNTCILTLSDRKVGWMPAPEDIDSRIAAVDNKFVNYSTTQQMNTAINQKADSITQSVSNTYATKTDLNSANGNITSLTSRMQTAESKLTKDSLTTTIGDYYTTSSDVDGQITSKGYATTSQLQQTATDLTATFNNGYNQGVTQMNAEGIKVYHNQIDGENYTHIAPSGFWIKYKGEDIFVCDQNGLTYKGTITGSTITGGTIKGTEVIGGSLNVEGTLTAAKIVCKDIDSPKYPGALTEDLWLYVGTDGSDDSELESGVTFETFNGLLDKLPKNLNGYEVSIEMSTDITENVEFKGFHGGKIKFHMKGHTLYGYVVSKMGSARINIYSGYIGNATDESNGWGKIHPSKGYVVSTYTTTVASVDQGAIGLYNIDVYGADNYLSESTTKLGVAGQDWGTAYLNGVSYYGCDIGARANAGGRIHDVLSYNVCTKYGFYATTGGYITLAGSEHSGGKTSNYREADAGKVIVASGATFAGGNVSVPSTPAPVKSTKTVTIKSKSGDTYRSTVYNSWKKDNTVRQGDYGYGDCNGIWLFGNQFEQFKGKNITKVVITISRQEGGQYASVDLNIKTHNYKSRPSGKPSYVGTVGTLGLAVNTTDKKTITDTNNAIITGLKAGTIKGIGLQSTYDSAHYAVCSGSVTIKITYTE